MNDAEATLLRAQLAHAWRPLPGVFGWITQVNHRAIGARFMVTAFIFFLIGGLEAIVMRTQLIGPNQHLIDPELFSQLFTMHGSTMMFLFAVPFLEGLGIYLMPLMIGTRDMAFPRLNAFGYWLFLLSGVALHWGLLRGIAPNAGWYNYPPLSGAGFSTGPNIHYWVMVITLLEISALVAAVELIVTFFKQRAPGMHLGRVPLFIWAVLVTSFMVIFAMPPLVVTSLFLALDRLAGMHFFNVAAGGEALLWQHIFWYFGHPDVYILLMPALGIIATVIPTAVRRPLTGYTLAAMSFVAIGIISFGLWVHHMYTVGLPLLGTNFFAAASMMITIPSALLVFLFIVTIWRGRPQFTSAFHFAVGFIVLFILGGITGIMIASPAFDWQVHDTYFIVAHFHYVLVGAVIFPILAAIYHWYPKIHGRLLSEGMGRWSFWMIFIGFNLTFAPLHIVGLEGMPRRIYTYLEGLGWERDNLLATLGAYLTGLGVMVTLINVILSYRLGRAAGPDPWRAATLEWTVSSPPSQYNFLTIPVLRGRHPLWEAGHEALRAPHRGMRIDPWQNLQREVLATTSLDAQPQARFVLPGPSVVPLWLAISVGVAFLGAMEHLIFFPLGLGLAAVTLLYWHWPSPAAASVDRDELPGLPLREGGTSSTAYWGMAWLVVIEATVVVWLIFSYFYLRVEAMPVWPPPGIPAPRPELAGIATFILLVSTLPVAFAVRNLRRGGQRMLRFGLPCALSLLIAYGVLSTIDALDRDYTWATNAYGSIVWTLTGYQLLHAAALFMFGGAVTMFAWLGHYDAEHPIGVEILALYWYFVALAGLPVYATVYLAPYLL